MKRFLIITIAILAILGLGFFVFTNLTTNQGEGTVEQTRRFFPFGGGQAENITPDESIDNKANPNQTQTTNLQSENRLIELYSKPVSGATFTTVAMPVGGAPTLVETIDLSGYPLFRVGDENEKIESIYTVFNNLDSENTLTPSTVFGEDLKERVVEFQTSMSLTPDGILGSASYATLNTAQGITDNTFEDVSVVRFVDKEKGFVLDYDIQKKETVLRTDTVIPQSHEALFWKNGSSVVYRILKSDNETIETFTGLISEDISDKDLVGEFLTQNIGFVDVANNSFFYTLRQGQNLSGYIYSSGGTISRAFTHGFTEWLPDWNGGDTVHLTSKPSFDVEGYLYAGNTNTGNLTRIYNGTGLTSKISPSKKFALISENEEGKPSLKVLDLASKEVLNTNLKTLPEKCVWQSDSTAYCAVPKIIQDAKLPDTWYQGVTEFNDYFFRVDTQTGISNLVFDPLNEFAEAVDGINLDLHTPTNSLYFQDKKTLKPYLLRL